MATVNFVGATKTVGPFAIDGYYPLYATETASNKHDGGNGTSHKHVFFGQDFFMPNGLTHGSTQFHGNYDGSLTAEYNQSAITNSASNIKGYYYYKLDKAVPEYHNAWKFIDEPSNQRIFTTYSLTQIDIDAGITEFYIGCYPDADATKTCGYDVIVKINAKEVKTFTYGATNREGFIDFGTAQILTVGDFIEITASSKKGLISTKGISKYELPLSWGQNTNNEDILNVSAPEYIGQFKSHIENQNGFTGEGLGANNYQDTLKVAGLEKEIVQTNQDTLLGAYLLDDQPGNLVDALRFNANEYVKFKSRLRHEIEKYYTEKSTTGLTNDYVLEQVLRNVTSFKIGNDIFNKTYILPFGDNYTKQDFTVSTGTTSYILSSFADLDKIENSLLVYLNNKLLVVEKDYTISSFSPITIKLVTTSTPGDIVCTKLYNAERDSAQCPPTPSTMGILPMYQPCIETDTSFKTTISTLVGHDGSKQKAFGDFRDDILLEFETRIYNSAKAEFRTTNSLPAYNSIDIRCGAFRETGYAHSEFYDLIRHYFSSWTISEKLDPVVNEFYNESDEWSWNYSNSDLPGHWRGWYEFHYDTVRPNTHPWEMLGFTEKPLWWDEEYYVYSIDDIDRLIPSIDYGSSNTKLWNDLEEGIIRQGPRKNTTSNKINNPYRRIGLGKALPVDADAKLISPYRIESTDNTTIATTWVASSGTADSTFAFRTNSFRTLEGINVTASDKLYVESNNLPTTTKATTEQVTSFVIPRRTQFNNDTMWSASPQIKAKAIAVLVNGDPLMSIDTGECWDTNKTYETSKWIYNKVQEKGLTNPVITTEGIATHYTIGPDVLGLTDWDSANASPVVGWAFDGLPIYGPYGYSDYTNNSSSIVRINSGWELDTRTRGAGNADEDAGPGGKPTGQFIRDFKISANAGATANVSAGVFVIGTRYIITEAGTTPTDFTLIGSENNNVGTVFIATGVGNSDTNGKAKPSGYTDLFNLRYSVTKDSATPIWHYVTTIDADSNPAFPYHVGGGIVSTDRWAGKYRQSPEATGIISSIDVLDAGGLYTSVPTITITGDGNNATATAVITDKKITSITINTAGSGYTYATATVTGGNGVRGKVRVNVSGKDNSTFAGTRNQAASPAIGSVKNVARSTQLGIDGVWKLGDGAPVENAFKYSSTYPFAIAEALLLAKPGRFATIFSDPTALERPAINNAQLLSKSTKKRWKFLNTTDFKIHGDVDVATGKMITNIGYTQFINSWLKYQGLDTVLNFVNPVRTLNVKLAHRMSGFIDKDTLSARTDQYSNDGNATTLIIPQENITTTLHSSNYKSRNFYTGVVIEQTKTGYRLRGFDKNRGYFEVYNLLKTGKTAEVEVGGEAEAFSVWEPNVTYSTGNIIQHRNNYYKAPLKITSGTVFDAKLWQRLAKLPQIGSAKAVHYIEKSPLTKRVSYETEFTTVQEVFDFLIGLGLHQQEMGFDFGEYSSSVGAVKDWAYSAKQFLFWTTGQWQIGNTIELSPIADKVKFIAPRGFIAKINRTDREQFSILDQIGEGIEPTECTIVRENDYIEVSAPDGKQIYSLMLFTKEVEHALVFDNTTDFSDVIYNPIFNQRHKRIKLKGQRTNNWKGKFLSQGFIIDGDELLPNLDNLAESLGRYHEFGFIPVEKQVYEASRALFGYTEKDYLTELDIQDDEQFDFYRGMIQGKGTSESLGRIARSSAVISGNVNIFDEWALRVGDFGDTENNQSIELKLVKSDIKQDPQLITLDFPENVTNVVERIDVIDAKYAYEFSPTIEISQPLVGGVQATATATLDTSTNKLQKIVVTNAGSGYGEIPIAKVLASNILISSGTNTLPKSIATTSNYFDFTQTSASIKIADNLSSNAAVVITAQHSSSSISAGAFIVGTKYKIKVTGTTNFTLIGAANNSVGTIFTATGVGAGSGTAEPCVTLANVITSVNNNTTINANVQIHLIPSEVISGSTTVTNYTAQFIGKDFFLQDGAGVKAKNFGHANANVHYQPIQRYAVSSAMAGSTSQTTIDDVEVKINGTAIANSFFSYDAGSVNTNTTTATYPSLDTTATRDEGNILYPEQNSSFTIALTTAIDTNNLEIDNDGDYKFIDLFIGNVLISNSHDSIAFGDHDNKLATADQEYTTVNGTMFTVAANGASITFPDISRLPDSVKTTIKNPPTSLEANGKQQQLVKVLTSGSVIKVLEKPTVQLDASLKSDVPGATINIRVTAQDGIAVRMGTKRNYLITEDDKTDNTILIDIDDAQRFIKKPTGVKENNLWPTTKSVNSSGLLDTNYPTIRNAGYVNSGNINFQAFDVASVPDLYGDDILIKPTTDDLIHIAKSENNDWNVYKLEKTGATVHYLERNSDGRVKLLTDDSLFQYLDTNEIGQPDTGKYLDYVLSIDNADLSNNIVVWNQENIVVNKQSQISDFVAPQMIQARIKSIGPRTSKTVSAVAPHFGKIIDGITLTPKNDSDTVVATGNTQDIEAFDAFQMVDGVGVVTQNPVTLSGPSNTDEVTVDPIRIDSITVSSAGSNYTTRPTVSITNSSGTDHATAVAEISGPISAISVVDGGSGYVSGAVTVVVGPPENVDATTGIADVATASATLNADGTITAISVTSGGSGYTSAPAITIIGDNTESAVATSTINASVDRIVMINKGSGYSAVTPTVTVSGNATATATKTTPTTTSIAQKYANAGNDATKVVIKLLGEMKDSLELKISPTRNASEQATFDAIVSLINQPIRLKTYNTSTGTFVLKHSSFAVSNVLTNIEVPGFESKVVTTYTPNGANHFTVTSTGFRRFEFEDITSGATLGYSTDVTIRHLNKSKLTINNHCLVPGDTARIFTNTFSGVYKVEQVIDGNNIVIKAPYIPGFTSGSVYGEGIEIKTVGAHGISPVYAESNKSIAVHFADPKAYNQRYIMDYVTPDSIFISGRWAPKTGTAVYYEHKVGTITGKTAYDRTNGSTATNIITVTDDVKLNEILVTYTANSRIVSPQFVTVEGNTLWVEPEALPSVTSASTYPAVELTVARQRGRGLNRYPLVTTLDHDIVNVNGSQFKIDNTNSAKAVESSINRAIKLRREAVRENKESGVEIGFVMMNDPNTPVFNDLPSKFVSNYGAYVSDKDLINNLGGGQLTADRDLVYSVAGEDAIDTQFSKGPDSRGPIYGLTYTDQDSGIYYVWDAMRSKYLSYDNLTAVRDSEAISFPQNHKDMLASPYGPWTASINFTVSANPLENIAYFAKDVVKHNGKTYQATADINMVDNLIFEVARWTELVGNTNANDYETYYTDEVAELNDALIPKIIPGTALQFGSKPGVKRKKYNMEETVTKTLADSSTVTIPHFRLMPSPNNIFEVYQAVQNDGAGSANGQVYYILLDLVNPELVNNPIDYYSTVNAYSTFGNYKKITYYYVNDIIPTVDTSNRITDAKDPVRIESTIGVISVPPVEPAVFIGLQTVEEPYAVSGGNNTDAVSNLQSIPDLVINDRDITVNTVGHNDYFMWVPGLTPGAWKPTAEGPGFLPGVSGTNSNFGYGRGYYAENDTHLPNDYPDVANYYNDGKTGYNGLMPRFMYSKKFTVNPPAVNHTITTYTDAEGNTISHSEADILGLDGVTTQPTYVVSTDEDIGVTGIRPEEVFVACFWTEAFTYKNQLVGLNYSTLNGAGQPTGIYDDYDGTVVRVKYIRLTELPANAYTQRLIPDTGWAGRGWNNRLADGLPEQPNEDNVFNLFNPVPVVGGATESEDTEVEITLEIGDAQNTTGQTVDTRGQLAPGLTNTQTVPVTEKGPIMNGEFLNNMPGPCATLPKLTSPNEDTRACDEVPNTEEYLAIDNLSAPRRGEDITLTPDEAISVGIDINSDTTYNDNMSFDQSRGASAGTFADTYNQESNNWQFINVKVAGSNALRVFFDFLEGEDKGMKWGGIAVVQNDEPYFLEPEHGVPGLIKNWVRESATDDRPQKEAEWWAKARVIESTVVSGNSIGTRGDQVARYGVDKIGNGGNATDSIVESMIISRADRAKITSTEEGIFITTPNKPSSADLQRVNANHIPASTGIFADVTPEDASINSDAGANATRWLANDIGVKGIGFIGTQVNCAKGEYITIFVRPDSGVTKAQTKTDLLWQAVVQFSGEVVDPGGIGEVTEECLEGHSTAYATGAVVRKWQGRDSWGYFGQHRDKRERFKPGQTSQTKCHLDNIYFPYNALPNPYNSNSYQNMPDATWGSWGHCHGDKNYGTYYRNQELAKSTTTQITRRSMPSYHTIEIKGYFRAPYTGRYMTEGYSDDGIWAWISSEPTNNTYRSKDVRRGIDDLAGFDGDTRHEYFKEDGWRQADEYNYHRDNALLRTGWKTTNDRVKSNKPGDRYVDLEAGKYYFMRVITGNNKGPGYYDMGWSCIPANNLSDFTLTIDDNQAEQNWTAGSIKRGRFTMSGRSCAVENPSGGGTTGTGTDSGGGYDQGGVGNENGQGGDQTIIEASWYNKYSAFATDSQAKAYEQQARSANVLDLRTQNFSGVQVSIWNKVGVSCPPGAGGCVTTQASQDTPGVSPGYTSGGTYGYTTYTTPQGQVVYIPENIYENIYEGIDVDGVGNSTTPGQRHLSGFNFMPYSMKLPTKVPADANNYSFSTGELDSSTAISGQAQRVSGGLTIPFAKKLTTVSRTPYVLKSEETSSQPWGKNLENSNDINKTTKYVKYNPKKIGSTATIGGKNINNITTQGVGNNWQKNGDTTEYTGPAYNEPGVNTETNGGGSTGYSSGEILNQGPLLLQDPQLAYADVDNIIYNQMPVINITPRAIDNNGNFYNGGPTASTYLRQPTPEVDIDLNDLIGIAEGTELLINGRRIVKRGVSGIDIKTQINCANMGVTAEINENDNTLSIISCNQLPFKIGNGCGGGTFKQVGDFHVNRGFDQGETISETFIAPFISPTAAFTKTGSGNATVAIGGGGGGMIPGTEIINDYRRLPDGNTEKFFYRPDDRADEYETPARIPLVSKNKSTGGSNYRVGDRLRLIGGTPETNTLGPLNTDVCIDSAGSGYTNPANISIIFNENTTTPGVGGAATVTELDENGGIAKVVVVNQGAAYDPENPPTLTVKDSSPIPTVIQIDSTWTSNITLSAGQIAQINEKVNISGADSQNSGTVIEKARFVRAIGNYPLGAKKDYVVASSDVSYITTSPNTVRIAFTKGDSQAVRPESYIKMKFFPGTSLNDYYITVNGAVTSSTTFVVDSVNDVTGKQYIKAGMVASKMVGSSLTIQGYVTNVNTSTKTITLDTAVTLTDEQNVYFVAPQEKLFYIPKHLDDENTPSVTTQEFYLQDPAFKSSALVTNMFGAGATITVTGREPWYANYGSGNLVDTIDPRIPKNDARLSISVGDPKDRKAGGPLRVAKFIVTDVDTHGAITGIRVIDRGLYKEFPTDLTMGIPLEYDYALQGALKVNTSLSPEEQTAQVTDDARRTLGLADPQLSGQPIYGGGHPEYQYTPFRSTSELAKRDFNSLSEYDYKEVVRIEVLVNDGATLSDSDANTLNTLLEKLISGLGYAQGFKHPDFEEYPEFVWDGQNFQPYTGSPGAYDPTTWACIDLRGTDFQDYQQNPSIWARDQFNLGNLILKTKVIETNPKKYNFGQYNPDEVAGGTGARVFLTAQEIPNCSERGTAKDQLGLPDEVNKIIAPKSLARNLNNALKGAGYNPDEVRAEFNPIGELGEINIISDVFPGIGIDSPNPGTLEKIGFPIGDYNNGMLCITAILEKEDGTAYSTEEAIADIQELYDTNDELGLLTGQELAERYPSYENGELDNTSIMTLICAEVIQPSTRSKYDSYGNGGRVSPYDVLSPVGPGAYGMNDNNSIFGDGAQVISRELFSYDITDLFGGNVKLNGARKQNAPVNYFASKRFNERNIIDPNSSVVTNTSATTQLVQEKHAWVDSYSNLRQAIIDNASGVTDYTNTVYTMDNYVEGGWAYLEYGVPKIWQTPLVDVNFITNALVYDPETGNKVNNLDFWDPFKGVLPGFIQNEISFISEQDPVSYNNARTNFGKSNIGKVWWDTSTIRYNWYEQGTDAQRNTNWGSAFPGSQVTICEWVESKAKPANWSGNGTPRWTDKFVTERRPDAKTGEYVMYYYYWIMNRTILDDKVKSTQGRKLDTRTIARYVADPVGYGLDMISFASDKSLLLHNISDIKQEESHLQINLSRNLNPEGISHTAWKLMREGDSKSIVPEHLSDKLIDSLCGENAEASPVPDPTLSEVEKYGISFRPRQTMFKDIQSARRIMVSVLNRILANTRVNSEYAGWDKILPTARAYLQTSNWYAVDRIDPITKESIRYTDSLKPIFNVTSVAELRGLSDVTDGAIVQVKSNQNDTEQLWMYNAPTKKFILVSVINDTVTLPSTIYTDSTNPTLSSELRLILIALRDNVFNNTSHWNELFFELMKHAYMEQQQLSWAFKTSYLYVEKEENDLTILNGFKADNFQKVLDYMNEVKPFSAKVREYKDGKKAPNDVIGQNNISDYDKPPFVDLVTGTVRILDDDLIQDKNIMSNSKQYIDYVTATADGLQTTDPIRRANTTISFDRTNWQLTEGTWDVANVSLESSIGYNIANLSVQTKQQVANKVDELYTATDSLPSGINPSTGKLYAVGDVKVWGPRAADKLFKFDAEVQAQFIAEVNTYYNDVTAARNLEIVGNGTVMAGLVASGQLKNTLALIKDKVGGNFRGETLDASKFSSIIDQADYMSAIQTDFGFDSDLFDENTDNDDTVFTDSRDLTNYGPVTTYGIGDAKWDNAKQVVSYEGVFDSNANPVTLRRSGDSYDGFDGITFQRVAYGEERPEELALLDPLESIIFTVTTSDFARGDTTNVSIFDELDTANATLYHPTTALKQDNTSVVIVNAGVGYKAPAVTITDALGNNPTTTAVATASVNAAGSVQSITVTNGGAGYTEINLALTETLTETTSAIAYIDANTIPLVSVANVKVGQIVTVNSVDIGEVASITGTTIKLNRILLGDVASGQVVNFRGQNFVYQLNNLIITATAGVDPDDADNFFGLLPGAGGGWDSTIGNDGAWFGDSATPGSFDVANKELQESQTPRVAPNAKEVIYRMHHSLFGDVDYLRISGTATTKLDKKMTLSSTSITVADASFLPNPTSIVPGSIWVGDERIQYGRRSGKVLSALTRGAFGTTAQDHANYTAVYSAEASEHFNHLNPSSNVWLDTGSRYGTPQSWDNDEWDEIEAANIATASVGVTITNVTSTTATLTAIGTGYANVVIGEGVRVFANANVSLFEVVEISANNSGVWTITASNQDTLDNTLFVNNGTATLRNFVYGAQSDDDDFDSASVTGQSALSLADRGNADLANINSIMKFLHKL